MTISEILRIIVFLATTMALIGCGYVWRRDKIPALITPITWLGNVWLFWLTRMLDVKIDIIFLNIWSGVIHLHACILIIGALIILGQGKQNG